MLSSLERARMHEAARLVAESRRTAHHGPSYMTDIVNRTPTKKAPEAQCEVWMREHLHACQVQVQKVNNQRYIKPTSSIR